MSLIFVDCEADGPCPGLGVLTEFGAVEYATRKTFHGVLWYAKPRRDNPAIPKIDPNAIQKTDAERVLIWLEFEGWLKQFDGRPIFISDNPAYDFQWINHGFWHAIGNNPFGHSGRRISDFYAGLMGDFYQTQGWKKFRVTSHDHNPVNDAMGNVEAFETLLKSDLVKSDREVWEEYERRKAQLPRGLTPKEYTEAIQRIVDELGL